MKKRISDSNLMKNTTVDVCRRLERLYMLHWKWLEGSNELAEVRGGGGGRGGRGRIVTL